MDPKLDYTGMRPLPFVVADVAARASALRREGDFEGAAKELGVVAGLAPRDLRVWLELAYVRVRAQRPAAAAEAYFQAAAIYAKRGYGRRALALGRRAHALDPASATPARLALLARRLGAVAGPLLEQCARPHLLLGHPSAARQLLTILLECDPSCLDRRWQLVQVELAQGDWVDAVDQLHLVAGGLLRQGRINDYVRAAEMALTYGGPNAELLRQLARIYRRTGERGLALAKLHKLHRIAPEDSEALEALARAEVELGKLSGGLAYLRELVRVAVAGGRGAVRSVLTRAEQWSDDEFFAGEVDRIRVATLQRPRRSTPPPPPPPPQKAPLAARVRRRPRSRPGVSQHDEHSAPSGMS